MTFAFDDDNAIRPKPFQTSRFTACRDDMAGVSSDVARWCILQTDALDVNQFVTISVRGEIAQHGRSSGTNVGHRQKAGFGVQQRLDGRAQF
jgi:hypothetical protein